MDCQTQLASLAAEEAEKGDFLYALKTLTSAIKINPYNPDLYFDRSICHYKVGDFQASLDDANAAIRLEATDYNVHYQKGLALVGLAMRADAVTSFKKAIELRAKQQDSKLSDIWKLLKDATNELDAARRKMASNASATATTSTQINNSVNVSNNNTTSNSSSTNNTQSSNINIINNNTNNKIDNRGSNSNIIGNTNIINISKNDNNANQLARYEGPSISGSSGLVAGPFGRASHVLPSHKPNQANALLIPIPGLGREPVDSTTDRHLSISQQSVLPGHYSSNHHQTISVITSITQSGNNLVAPIRNTTNNDLLNPASSCQLSNDNPAINRVSSSVSLEERSIKRVLITPSSSMPASTSRDSLSTTPKDDSYSSKYKRLRRDRERARRGTSKLCTIKHCDLDDLQKPSNSDPSGKRSMRVIAPIDGWLYSGQLTIDESRAPNGTPRYVVKLDGDRSGSSYLFNQETVLNDVIKEVRVKSVSDLRKGARICCYWSRQYKCLSTGVVTSRTFEETKSLVSVKYDNGDLSALPLEDLRLLPPDYPKYMSNCDPLLLARQEDSSNVPAIMSNSISASNISNTNSGANNDVSGNNNIDNNDSQPEGQLSDFNPQASVSASKNTVVDPIKEDVNVEDEDDTIPTTDETIDFITSETSLKIDEDDDLDDTKDVIERIVAEGITIAGEGQLGANDSRSSSEENNFGVEYRPWMFEGPPKRSKRHGRTYRENYSAIRRGNEVLRVGDSAELMPRDQKILPFVAKIEGIWATCRGEKRVRVRWYYRLSETEGEPYELKDGDSALFETDHFDENDVQSIYRSAIIQSWTEYSENNLGLDNRGSETKPKVYYLAGYYDPVRRIKHLRSDVKEAE